MKNSQVAVVVCAWIAAAAAAPPPAVPKTWVETEAGSPTGPYLVIDLTPRQIAVGKQPDPATAPATIQGFVVNNLAAVPAGGWTDEYKTTKLVLRRIPAGTFTMGSLENELGRDADEAQHAVTLTKDFYLGVFEVTMRQWELVMGEFVGFHRKWNAPDWGNMRELHARPVEQVSYFQIREKFESPDKAGKESPVPSHDPAVDWPANSVVNRNSFIGKLRAKTGLAGLDLPTEAQWEYACRAGTATALGSGRDLSQLYECPNVAAVGRYLFNGDKSEEWSYTRQDRLGTAVVGSYAPNQWGLYDLHGNVWEWCLDWYAPLSAAAATDPKGPATGQARVLRGGSWDDRAKACRAANRGAGGAPSRQSAVFGFRVALTAP